MTHRLSYRLNTSVTLALCSYFFLPFYLQVRTFRLLRPPLQRILHLHMLPLATWCVRSLSLSTHVAVILLSGSLEVRWPSEKKVETKSKKHLLPGMEFRPARVENLHILRLLGSTKISLTDDPLRISLCGIWTSIIRTENGRQASKKAEPWKVLRHVARRTRSPRPDSTSQRKITRIVDGVGAQFDVEEFRLSYANDLWTTNISEPVDS